MDNRKVYEDALRTFGAESQTKMLFEEMGELMQAVCKASCVKDREQRAEVLHNIAEEIADVKIMLCQMELLFDVEDAVEEFKKFKIDRLAKWLAMAHGCECAEDQENRI